jgi:hypothetical protein
LCDPLPIIDSREVNCSEGRDTVRPKAVTENSAPYSLGLWFQFHCKKSYDSGSAATRPGTLHT